MILLKAVQLWNEISQQQDICWPLTGLVKYEHQRGKNRHILSHHEGKDGGDCRDRGERLRWLGGAEGLVVAFPYPVHDVQLTAESLDGTADLQQLEPQSVVYGQTGRHPVGEV